MRLILLSSSPATNIVTYPMQTSVNYFCLCQSQLFQNNLCKPAFFTFINTFLLPPQWSTFQVPLKSLSSKFEFPKTLTELLVCSTVSVLSCLTGIIQYKDSWWWSSLFRMKSENQGDYSCNSWRPKAQEPGALMSKSRKRYSSSRRERERYLASFDLLFHSGPQSTGWFLPTLVRMDLFP